MSEPSRTKDYETKSVLVYDNGLFVELAATLAKDFGKVYYYSPWQSAFPKSNAMLVGQGIPGVERVNEFEDHIDDTDLFVFPDVYAGALQRHLAGMGKRVWGSRMGEDLELDRMASKAYLQKLGVPIGKYTRVKGLTQLRAQLKLYGDQWVKVSCTRGDFESFHSKNYKNIEPRLDELEHNLGAKKHTQEFIVEDGINDAVEIGYDGYTVNGDFPDAAMIGVEVKDKGYIGHFVPASQMPDQITEINRVLYEALESFQYRNFLSMEMRITKDGTPWVIDPCCRMGSPPGELVQIMYTNLADIFWHGADGLLVNPIPAAEWGAELLIHSAWADKNWQAIQFPKELRDHIKLRNLTVINREYYVVPQAVGLPEIGAVVATGNTVEEAMEKVKEVAEQIDGYFLDLFPDCLEDAQTEIATLKEYGIDL